MATFLRSLFRCRRRGLARHAVECVVCAMLWPHRVYDHFIGVVVEAWPDMPWIGPAFERACVVCAMLWPHRVYDHCIGVVVEFWPDMPWIGPAF